MSVGTSGVFFDVLIASVLSFFSKLLLTLSFVEMSAGSCPAGCSSCAFRNLRTSTFLPTLKLAVNDALVAGTKG